MERTVYDQDLVAASVLQFLQGVGEDPSREGLVGTPDRVSRAWRELLGGYGQDPKEILRTSDGKDGFAEIGGYDEMIVVSGIEFYSTCEHHLLPFTGKIDLGYIPGDSGKVVGLSKLPRLVEVFARRLQVQERLTRQIAEAMNESLSPMGVGVRVSSEHACMTCRGVRKQSRMVTEALLGNFREHPVRAEFWELANRGAR